MIVFMITLEGTCHPIFCSKDETVEDLKLRWEENYGVNRDNRLVFREKRLADSGTLHDYKIRHGSRIYQAARLGGRRNFLPSDRMLECNICFEEFARLEILSCYHTGFCKSCAENLDKCPLCRKKI